MNPGPVKVKAMSDFLLLVSFDNGETRIFDVKPLLGFPLYEKLRNRAFFSTAKADGMCVYWNDDIDICPDMTYAESQPVDTDFGR